MEKKIFKKFINFIKAQLFIKLLYELLNFGLQINSINTNPDNLIKEIIALTLIILNISILAFMYLYINRKQQIIFKNISIEKRINLLDLEYANRIFLIILMIHVNLSLNGSQSDPILILLFMIDYIQFSKYFGKNTLKNNKLIVQIILILAFIMFINIQLYVMENQRSY